jgi:hypothetical protein
MGSEETSGSLALLDVLGASPSAGTERFTERFTGVFTGVFTETFTETFTERFFGGRHF